MKLEKKLMLLQSFDRTLAKYQNYSFLNTIYTAEIFREFSIKAVSCTFDLLF